MPDLREKVIEHVKCAHAALDAANADIEKRATADKQVHDLIPAVVEALVQHARIDPTQREKAAEILKDPVQVMQLLIKTADNKNTIRPTPLGAPQTDLTKQAGARSRYTGERTSEKTAADLAFETALLGPNR